MIQLTDAQINILTNAAKEPTKDVRESLNHIRNPQFQTRVLENLAKAEMIQQTTDGIWFLTDKAKAEFCKGWTKEQMAAHLEFEKELNAEEPYVIEEKAEEQLKKVKSITQFAGIKGKLCDALASDKGLSIDEFSKKHKWMEKTVRGTMSIIKKETGMMIGKFKDDEKNYYRFQNI